MGTEGVPTSEASGERPPEERWADTIGVADPPRFSAGKPATTKAAGRSEAALEQARRAVGAKAPKIPTSEASGEPQLWELGAEGVPTSEASGERPPEERWADTIGVADPPTFSVGKRATTKAGGRSRCRIQAAAGRGPATCAARSNAKLEQARRAVGAKAPKKTSTRNLQVPRGSLAAAD